MTQTPEDRDFDRRVLEAQARREYQGQDKPGLTGKAEAVKDRSSKIYAAFRAATDPIVKRATWLWHVMDPVLLAGGRFVYHRVAPRAYNMAKGFWQWAAFKKDAEGIHHFSPVRLGLNMTKLWGASVVAPFIGFGAYYYGTIQVHPEVYLPATAVFQSQQFLHPGETGAITNARDQIHSIMGKVVGKDGHIGSQYYEIDTNMYIWALDRITGEYPNAANPQKLATGLNSMSTYGLKCRLVTTGFNFNPLPRYFRFRPVQWISFFPEIIKSSCVELKELPDVFKGVIEEGKAEPFRMPGRIQNQVATNQHLTVSTHLNLG